MNPTHQREQAIFEAAFELPVAGRPAYLDQATAGEPALRARVESLLQNYEAGDFLEQAAAPMPSPSTIDISDKLGGKPGDKIGRYKLLQQIGEGGCGIVYLAEQEEPIRRRVALKIIKLGMDTKSVIARFEAERQALALMDHPNIAKVFDAGATATGRPYFVMELVRGVKVTDYCDERGLSIRDRLDLFTQICGAVQHAHQKGIIHRDLKPSNILVTVNDGVAVPKVIDFGIAKATGQQLTDKTLFTAFEQFIGTPAYMSPEQAVMTSLDVDTRSDIYALGVLLYELLTGKTPFDSTELMAIGLDEMRRTIREKEPARPSTRLSTMARDDLGALARRRNLDAPRLVSELRGDLDWIVMKCLEKDRARRYETVGGLAQDIQRHLGDLPILARPPGLFYRTNKLLRRHRRSFISIGAVATALFLGFGISAGLHQFSPEAIEARQRRQLLEAADRLGTDNTNVYPYAIKLLQTLIAHGKADEAAKLADSGLDWIRQHPEWPSPIRLSYLDIINSTLKQDWSCFNEAALIQAERLRILRTTTPVDQGALCNQLGEYAWTLLFSGQLTNAEVAAREVIPLLHARHDYIGEFWAQSMLGESLTRQHRYAEAEPLLRSAYAGQVTNQDKIPAGWAGLFFGEIIQRNLDYSVATGQTNETMIWQKRVADFNRSAAAKNPSK